MLCVCFFMYCWQVDDDSQRLDDDVDDHILNDNLDDFFGASDHDGRKRDGMSPMRSRCATKKSMPTVDVDVNHPPNDCQLILSLQSLHPTLILIDSMDYSSSRHVDW